MIDIPSYPWLKFPTVDEELRIPLMRDADSSNAWEMMTNPDHVEQQKVLISGDALRQNFVTIPLAVQMFPSDKVSRLWREKICSAFKFVTMSTFLIGMTFKNHFKHKEMKFSHFRKYLL